METTGNTATSINWQLICEAKAKIEAMSKPAPIRIHTDHRMVETVQYKFPRKKKNRRWNKKYRKKYSITRPMQHFYLCDAGSLTGLKTKMIVCHPAIEDWVVEQVKNNGIETCDRR